MLTYQYSARGTGGQLVKATVQADNEQAAAKLIHGEGLTPVDIKLANSSRFEFLDKFTNRVTTKDKVLFSRQLATLINAGLPIIQSLRSVSSQTSNKKFQVIISQIIADVEGGMPLSKAMSKYPNVFNQVYLSLIAAGEASGTLDKALERLATQQEKDAELISKIRGAMAYPIIVIIVMILVVGFMIIKVLPQVKVLYSGLSGAHLPFITVWLLDLSDFLVKFWWLVIILFGGLFFGLFRWVRYTPGGRRAMDKIKIKMWPTGPLFMKMYMARFARTASTLVASGVPLIQVLEITGKAINNVWIEDALKRATEKVKGGKSLSSALQKEPDFLELVPNMLSIGEQSGSMEQMLSRTADYYEREVDEQIKSISTLIEPVLMILLGVVALIIVAAILLPIYGLANQGLGGGNGAI